MKAPRAGSRSATVVLEAVPAIDTAGHKAPLLEQVYVYPGQLYASARPCAVSTILGTCVSVCLWDPVSQVGGLNHYLLPYPAEAKESSSRFGGPAIDQLLERVLFLGARRERLRAKVFGGMNSQFAATTGRPDLGASNVTLALDRMRDEGIPVVARDVGGERGRKLIFHLDDGSVWIRPL